LLLDSELRQVIWSSFDRFVQVHLHQLEDKRQPARGLIVQNFDQLDDMRVGVQSLQRFDLAQVVYLLQAIKVRLHAFDSDILAIAQGLRLEHFTKRAFSQLPNESVLCRN